LLGIGVLLDYSQKRMAAPAISSRVGQGVHALAPVTKLPVGTRKSEILSGVGQMPDASTSEALVDDVKFHFRNALIDHSYSFSGRR
jgi:hypothetical protein